LSDFYNSKKEQKYIIIELGVEPWTYRQIYERTPEEQTAAFTMMNSREY
jgi:hypothetical protein